MQLFLISLSRSKREIVSNFRYVCVLKSKNGKKKKLNECFFFYYFSSMNIVHDFLDNIVLMKKNKNNYKLNRSRKKSDNESGYV